MSGQHFHTEFKLQAFYLSEFGAFGRFAGSEKGHGLPIFVL